QEISCGFGYLSATCRSARARFLSPIDGANITPELVPRLRCPIPDATVDQSPASGGVGNRADELPPPAGDERRRNFEAQRLRPGMPISFIFENGAQAMCKR